MRRSAPPPTSKYVPVLAMVGTAREVLDMDKNSPAPRFLRKVAQVSQSRNLSRNAPLCPRKAVNRCQCKPQEKAVHLCPSRTASRSPSRTAPGCPRRTAAVFLYKLQPRLPRRSAVVVVVVVALVAIMDKGMVKCDTMDLQKHTHLT